MSDNVETLRWAIWFSTPILAATVIVLARKFRTRYRSNLSSQAEFSMIEESGLWQQQPKGDVEAYGGAKLPEKAGITEQAKTHTRVNEKEEIVQLQFGGAVQALEKQGSSRFDFTSSAALDALSCIAEFDFQGLETHDSWHTASLEKADFGDKHHEGMETLIRGIGDDHVSVDRLLGFPSEIQDADLFEESDSIDVPGDTAQAFASRPRGQQAEVIAMFSNDDDNGKIGYNRMKGHPVQVLVNSPLAMGPRVSDQVAWNSEWHRY